MTALVRAALAASALGAAAPTLSVAPRTREPAAEVPGKVAWGQAPGVLTLAAPGSKMILVPASRFAMGSTDDEVMLALAECQKEPLGQKCEAQQFSDELPLRRVTLSSFWMDRTEVTVADYARCVALHRCEPLPLGEGARRFDRPAYPASLVTWDEARAYCAFRGARLPTEAEFERVARGPRGRRYPWGELYNSSASNHGRYDWLASDASDGFAELAPVGSFPAGRTPDGFLDLAGNVSEWVFDRYAALYSESDVVDPQGPTLAQGSAARVVRGGSYETAAPWLRGAARAPAEPGIRRPSIGFRCAKTARPSRE